MLDDCLLEAGGCLEIRGVHFLMEAALRSLFSSLYDFLCVCDGYCSVAVKSTMTMTTLVKENI